jgi:hypothetical protein
MDQETLRLVVAKCLVAVTVTFIVGAAFKTAADRSIARDTHRIAVGVEELVPGRSVELKDGDCKTIAPGVKACLRERTSF